MFRRTPKFSNAIVSDLLPDELCEYGLEGRVTLLAFDALQSLYAVATDRDEVHILGYGTTKHTILLPGKGTQPHSELIYLDFVRGIYLVAVTRDCSIFVYALDTREFWTVLNEPGRAHSCYTDPSIDWLFVGFDNGQVAVYDVDHQMTLATFRIDNLQRQLEPSSRMSPVLSVSMHPLDLGRILLCYSRAIAVFNLTDNSVVLSCLAKDVPGSDRNFYFQSAQWHPTGSHIVAICNKGTTSFWDGEKGQYLCSSDPILAPSLVSRDPSAASPSLSNAHILRWCSSTADPNVTFVASVVGSQLVFNDFGPTPGYTTTSYARMGSFYSSPRAARVMSLDAPIRQILPLPLRSPFYNGSHDTRALAVLTEAGTISIVQTPKCIFSFSPSQFLPPALSWVSSPTSFCAVAHISRLNWSGMAIMAPRPLVSGGPEVIWRPRRTPQCSVILRGGVDGAIQLFEGSKSSGPEFRVLETSIRSLYKEERDCQVSAISLAGETAELACASAGGNVYLFSYTKNGPAKVDQDARPMGDLLQSLAHADLNPLKECFRPRFVVRNQQPSVPVTCLSQSEVGFVAIGYADGRIIVCDRRGPEIIFDNRLDSPASAFAFSVLAVADQPYSSLVFAAGTSRGMIFQFTILPAQGGRFRLEQFGQLSVFKDPVKFLCGVDLANGRSAEALPKSLSALSQGGPPCIGGFIASSPKEVRLVPVSKLKSHHKSLHTPVSGQGFVCLREGDALGFAYSSKDKARVLSIPDFKTISSVKVAEGPAHFNINGDILVEQSPSSAKIYGLTGTGVKLESDLMVSKAVQIPMRPTISTVSWLKGQIFVRPSDLDLLMGGANRPASKRPKNVQSESDHAQQNLTQRQRQTPSGSRTVPSQGQKTWAQTFNDYYDSADNAVNDTLDGWMETLASQKKSATNSAVKGVLRNKLGF